MNKLVADMADHKSTDIICVVCVKRMANKSGSQRQKFESVKVLCLT